MNEHQELFGRIGGCHAASVFSQNGRMLAPGKDVCRRYAVEETVEEIREQGSISESYLHCVRERISFEIGSNAARAALSELAAVSAPLSLAKEYCRDAGITVIGFCRGQRATAYFHAGRSLFHLPWN